jgi:hypothetical protein
MEVGFGWVFGGVLSEGVGGCFRFVARDVGCPRL